MNKFLKFSTSFLVIVIFLVPTVSFAQNNDVDNGGLVPCGSEVYPPGYTMTVDGIPNVDVSGQVKNPCGFKHVLTLVNKVIRFILFVLVVPIAAIMFAYTGFLLLTSGGDPGKKKKAKEIFANVFWGLIIAAAAWLIIRTILSLLGYDGAWIGF